MTIPYRKSKNGGLIRTIILVVIFLLVISYFGLNLREVINDPLTQNNFSYVWGEVVHIWTTYLSKPIGWLWREVIVKYIVMLGTERN
jgi:hypothetical protein